LTNTDGSFMIFFNIPVFYVLYLIIYPRSVFLNLVIGIYLPREILQSRSNKVAVSQGKWLFILQEVRSIECGHTFVII